jgi:4-diphosphocytidyl-2-C-methyl-D-erythritol kinase
MPERLAHAKINLRLCVLAQEPSGYHQIETLLCRISLADRLVVEPAPQLTLEVDGGDAGPVADNLVLRAARAFYDRTAIAPAASFRLTKRIPAGAGLGGGSSDAAAALHLLNELHDTRLEQNTLLEIGFALGSDVPFFVSEAPYALAWGRGERLLALRPPPARPVLIAVPAERVPTASAYAELARTRSGKAPVRYPLIVDAGTVDSWAAVERLAKNDFEAVMDRGIQAIPMLRETLLRTGARIAQMTGSGSAVFGVFDDVRESEVAAREIAAVHAGVLVFVATTG